MNENQVYKRKWKRFISFTLIVGLIVGIFSVISDSLPNIADGVTTLEFVVSYFAVMINSLPMWFILAMLVGYVFARTLKEAALFGTIYTLVAITFYLVISYFYVETPVEVSVEVSFKEHVVSYAIWYRNSIIGSFIGGSVGFLVKKTPYALLILLVGIIFQMFLYGRSSWENIVGIALNVTFCLMIISIVFYIVNIKIKKKTNLAA